MEPLQQAAWHARDCNATHDMHPIALIELLFYGGAMRRTGFGLLLVSILFSPPSHSQSFTESKFGPASIRLVIPKGYCKINRDDPLGALHYQLQERGNAGKNAVAILFSDCAEWAKRKADPAYVLQRHGNYLFQLTNGEEALLPPRITRADVIKIYTDYELKRDPATAGRLRDHLQEKLAGLEFAPNFKGHMNHGMIDADAVAVYLGTGSTLEYPTGTVRVVGVTAATTTRQIPVTLNLYGPVVQSKSPFGELLVQQKALVRSFIAANE
jgi:hypothetical protein